MKTIYAQEGKISPERLTPYAPFAAVPLLEYGGLNLFSCFLGGRSDAACRVVIRLHAFHLWSPYGFSNDAARRVATVFEKWDFLIETYLCARRENLPRKIDPLRSFRRGFPFGIRRSKTYSPNFSKDVAARRVVIRLGAVPVDLRMGVNDGQCRIALPAMPPVGAGSSQREDSPARRPLHGRIPCQPTVFTTMRYA